MKKKIKFSIIEISIEIKTTTTTTTAVIKNELSIFQYVRVIPV